MTMERTPAFWAGYTRGVHMAAAAAGKAGTDLVATLAGGEDVERVMAALRASHAGITNLIETVPAGAGAVASGDGYRSGVEAGAADAVGAVEDLPDRLRTGERSDEDHAALMALVERLRQGILVALLDFSTHQQAASAALTPR